MFSASSALEGVIAIANDDKNTPRLSEQEGVDCTNRASEEIFGKFYGNYGCDGGLEYNWWDFLIDHNGMLYDDYPYVTRE